MGKLEPVRSKPMWFSVFDPDLFIAVGYFYAFGALASIGRWGRTYHV
jgi:hypothetical protein